MRCSKRPSVCGYSQISNPRLILVALCKCIAWSLVSPMSSAICRCVAWSSRLPVANCCLLQSRFSSSTVRGCSDTFHPPRLHREAVVHGGSSIEAGRMTCGKTPYASGNPKLRLFTWTLLQSDQNKGSHGHQVQGLGTRIMSTGSQLKLGNQGCIILMQSHWSRFKSRFWFKCYRLFLLPLPLFMSIEEPILQDYHLMS